jgi:ferric-dicitrate binding protein FerR (iron transport regulator)
MTEKDDCGRSSEIEADRIESAALAALRGDGNPGPLEPLDDVARRRFIDGVLAAADASPAFLAPRRRRARIIAASLAVAAAVAFGIAIAFGPLREADRPAAPAAIPDPVAPARVLLASGRAKMSGARARVGGIVDPGARLATGSGELWIGLPTGFTISLSAETRVTVRRLDREALVLALDGGRLLVSAVPGRQGPRLVVETRDGDVTVKGTVLSIDDRSGSVEVLVARGLVEVARKRGAGLLEIGPSEAVALDDGQSRASLPEEDAELLGRASAFDILDAESEAAVDLRSVPPGAAVEIDGVRLGTTPLAVAVRAGHRRLEVSLGGHPPVSEIVSLTPGSVVARYFDLGAALGESEVDGAGLAAGPAPGFRAPAKPAPSETAAELLSKAQERRAARDFAGAAKAYQELLRLHPSSDEARAALVSLGQLEVDRLGDPASALRHFDAYLRAGGKAPLGVEALLGRARSLRALGRVGEEREALERFLAEHPDAIQAPVARRRLEEIRGTGAMDGQGP